MGSSACPDQRFKCVFCQDLLRDLLNPYWFPIDFQQKIDEVKNRYLQNPILNPDLKFILEIENILLSDETEPEKIKQLIAYISNQDWSQPIEDSIIDETLDYLSNDGMALEYASLFVQSLPEAVRCAINNNIEAAEFVFRKKIKEGLIFRSS